MRTCKQVHDEVTEVLYGQNEFRYEVTILGYKKPWYQTTHPLEFALCSPEHILSPLPLIRNISFNIYFPYLSFEERTKSEKQVLKKRKATWKHANKFMKHVTSLLSGGSDGLTHLTKLTAHYDDRWCEPHPSYPFRMCNPHAQKLVNNYLRHIRTPPYMTWKRFSCLPPPPRPISCFQYILEPLVNLRFRPEVSRDFGPAYGVHLSGNLDPALARKMEDVIMGKREPPVLLETTLPTTRQNGEGGDRVGMWRRKYYESGFVWEPQTKNDNNNDKKRKREALDEVEGAAAAIC
ncbi:MAG: hypothetical protein M1834_003782 [Cirrosporium novae-zelandiae]|nr:MAG: hypothetical protein M1834_003782 [Cirrosporium novae-zelandiae]